MKTLIAAAATFGLLLVAASPADTQERWGLELRVDGAMPTQDIGTDELNTGMGFEGAVTYRFLPHLGTYLGWDWRHFGADQSFAGSDVDLEETGYAFGLKFEHPFRGETGFPAWWVRAGGTYDHLEIEDQEGELIADSGHGLGWEAGAGAAFALTGPWRLTPGLRYRALSRDVEVEGVTTDVDLRYVTFELGVALSF